MATEKVELEGREGDNSGHLEPGITVLIPAYHASRTIKAAVQSSLFALPSSGKVIVFIDGKCPKTEDVLARIKDDRLSWIGSDINLGAREARQRLLDAATTKLVATLDADDISLPWRFRMQTRALLKKDAEIVFSNSIRFGRALGFPWLRPELPLGLNFEQIEYSLAFSNPLVNSSMLAYRHTLQELGGYKAEIEDLGLWLEAAIQRRVIHRTGFWGVCYRIHAGQLSRTLEWNSTFRTDEKISELRTMLEDRFSQFLDLMPGFSIQEELRRRFLSSHPAMFVQAMGLKATLVYLFMNKYRRTDGSFEPNPIQVDLVGGLGNQLFGLIAGIYVAEELNTHLIIHDGFGSEAFNIHGSSVRSFRVPLIFQLRGFASRRFRHRISSILNLLTSDRSYVRGLLEKVLGVHTSSVIGRDQNISRVRAGMVIRGYFQTHVFADRLRELGKFPELDLREPSNWFLAMSSRLRFEDPIIVHIRRGDYANPENTATGQLDPDFFMSAIQTFHNHSLRPIWFFSDDRDLDVTQFNRGFNLSIEVIVEPEGTDPAEVMKMMSEASAIVISNSTFSWWAAYLGQDKQVVAPSKWFKEMEDPEDLIPPNWLRVESTWL